MFELARIKLTAWYLAIIVAISLSFSVAIYLGINRELARFENLQTVRQQRVDRLSTFLRDSGLPIPQEFSHQPDSESIEQARLRIISILGIINLSIFVLAGVGGYFLAGETLDPIAKMVSDQKDFVSNASHELRTPLTSLKTEIEVALRDKQLNLPNAKNFLKSNLEDVNKMQRLSNYLLELNRYENGDKLTFVEVDLKNVALNAIKAVENSAKAKQIKILSKLANVKVEGNEDSLIELITILLDNAIKYSHKNKSVEVRTKSDGILEIADHGAGISKEDLPHIFDRFYRSDKSRDTDGYGLGLSIAKSIVDLHKGKVEVESKIGNGTTFKVTI